MRHKLAVRDGQRCNYVARLAAYGVRHPTGGRRKRRGCAMFKDLRSGDRNDYGLLITDHVWTSFAEPFTDAGVAIGQHVFFTAVAEPYLRGHHTGRKELDYHLNQSEDVRIIDARGQYV